MNELRVVIDTSVVVAFDAAADHGRLLLSDATTSELDEVLRRPKFNKYTVEKERIEFLAALIRQAEAVAIVETVIGCRDRKDDKFLERAVNGRASHLVSGDTDLLILNPFRGIEILTPQEFLSSIKRTFG